MAEKGHTSSMTSVTEDEISADSESDTTESSYSNYHPTSSVLSSTDTDDKLTPGVINISLSSTTNQTTETSHVKNKEQESTENITLCEGDNVSETEGQGSDTDAGFSSAPVHFEHPYGCNPLPLRSVSTSSTQSCESVSYPFHRYFDPFHQNIRTKIKNENKSLDDKDTESKDGSSTFGESVSQKPKARHVGQSFFSTTSHLDSTSEGSCGQTFLPDWTSQNWHRARCFDHYWSHYKFVMEWYQLHLKTVTSLQWQVFNGGRHPFPREACWPPVFSRSSSAKNQPRVAKSQASKKKSKRRRRKRRRATKLATLLPAAMEDGLMTPPRPSEHSKDTDDAESDDSLEMEITDTMMEFFATSYKHKLEREKAGSPEESMEASSNPVERPLVRRTEEMRQLYGEGAPMIQGMETAMQMTFDRFLDRYQPSLWPNMPLKITFAK